MTRARGDRGSVAVEAAVVAPALVVLLLLVVFAGRVAQADGDVRRAAAEAARAASLRQDPADARQAAVAAAAAANLAARGVGCDELDTKVDTDRLEPGGQVTVTVRCVASMADVTLLGVPGTRVFEARSIEIVDRYVGNGMAGP